MKETNIYTGGKNPNRRNSYNGKIRYQKWEQEKIITFLGAQKKRDSHFPG